MKAFKLLPLLCAVVLTTTMCKNQTSQPDVKFTGFKSGIITRTIQSGENTSIETEYIDDYGKVWFTYLVKQGEDTPLMITAADSEHDYYIFPQNNDGWKLKHNPAEVINWLDLSDETVERFQIKKIGQEEVLGKMCDMYSLVISSDEPAGVDTSWVWQGVELKQNSHSWKMGDSYYMVTDLQIDVPIPAEKVTIPEGIVFEEN